MLKIIHCVIDDKFTKSAINGFEFLSNRCISKYVLITNQPRKVFKFVSNLNKVEFVKENNFLKYLETEKCDYVILHNFYSLRSSLIIQIPDNIRVVWFSWGMDIYGKVMNEPFVYIPNMYHQETKKLLEPNFKERLDNIKRWIIRSLNKNVIVKAVTRVDYYSGVIPEEYDMMKCLSFFRAKPVDFRYSSPYGGIELSLLDEETPKLGNDILIGNSGDPRNNHADIFLKLKDIDLRNRKIIVPLSYAGTRRYREQIKSLGKAIWGDNFIALENYLPYKEYKNVISTCGFTIFGQERQQAMGNINIALRTGCKVFVFKTSIIYKHFEKYQIKMYSIDDDLNSDELMRLPSKEETYINRKRAIERTLTSKQQERLHRLIDYFEEELIG